MSNKGKNHSKKWLITRLKTSGSKRYYTRNEDYADTRHSKRRQDWESLPSHEGMGKSYQFFNGKINYGLLVRFLRGKVGEDWAEISQEIQARIPRNLREYQNCVQWFVADLVEQHEEGLWDKRAQKYLRLDASRPFNWNCEVHKAFYVDPQTQRLMRIPDFPSKRTTKGMDSEQIRKFREKEKYNKLARKRRKKIKHAEALKAAQKRLKNQASDQSY